MVVPMSQPLRQSAARKAPTFVQTPPSESRDPANVLREALQRPRVSIPPRFLYDDLGSQLFTVITALEEYYPTRTEAAIVREHLPALAAAVPVAGCTLVDLGAGDCKKAAALFPTVQPSHYVAVDVSAEFLRGALGALQRRFPAIEMCGVGTDFSRRLTLPNEVPGGRRLFFYPGSSIGNFARGEAVQFLQSVREQMHGDGVLWIGVDLQKPVDVLLRAYDDALGVTAAFDKNVLRHTNRLAGTDFDPRQWRHVARYDEAEHRIEMHLEATDDVTVTWPGGERRFASGERILTEYSHKYSIDGFTALLAEAGLRVAGHWTDPKGWFGVFVAVPS